MNKAITYLRVSTEEQAEKGFSLQAQRYECIEKAKELNCEEVMEFCDEGVSGSILERPMLLDALEALKQHTINYFICYDPSRLSRNVSHQLILIDNIKKFKTKLVFVRSGFEDTAEGRFQITIMSAVDEYERARLKIRTELGKRAKANQKLLTHNPNIYGYIFDKETDSLLINLEQAQIVKMMYNWLLQENLGPTKIADKLNELHIPTMRNKQWSRVGINRILRNFSYTGTLYIRRYDTRDYKLNKFKKKKDKVSIVEKPKDQWIGIEIPAIIDKHTWEKAKLMLDKGKRIYKNSLDKTYLLSGLLKCGCCGGTMFGKTVSKKNHVENRYYCCSNKYNYKLDALNRCNSRLFKAEEIEAAIWNKVRTMIINITEIEKLLAKNIYIDTMDKGISYQSSNRSFIIEEITTYIDKMTILEKNQILNRIIKDIIIEDNIIRIKAYIPRYIIDEFQT